VDLLEGLNRKGKAKDFNSPVPAGCRVTFLAGPRKATKGRNLSAAPGISCAEGAAALHRYRHLTRDPSLIVPRTITSAPQALSAVYFNTGAAD
jgi:hypothetical protein